VIDNAFTIPAFIFLSSMAMIISKRENSSRVIDYSYRGESDKAGYGNCG
jgi:hypothetical protein